MLKVNNVQLADRIKVPTERKLTDAGQMHVPCKFARTGSQLYTANQLGLVDRKPNEVITVWRDEADVFAADSMDTFRSAPVTIGHPRTEEGLNIPVTSENAKELQVGMLEGMPTRDEDTLGGTLVLTAQEAIDALEDGTQELSAGYTCDIEDVDGKYFQRNIRANHIAIVAKGRAGASCRISDEAMEAQEAEVVVDQALTDAQEALAASQSETQVALADVAAQVALVDELKLAVEAADLAVEGMKVELADAKAAAEQGVVERCAAMENARLIADIRDLGDKTVEQIERMVVEDQMPEKDLTGKSDAFISAMFEILVDASKGETPMGALLKQQAIVDTKVPTKTVSKVEKARNESIARSKVKA